MMSSGSGASLQVCQVPGCTTAQHEIEAELSTYLNGYCQACGKDRKGDLCGCAFPCSLKFHGPMLQQIHALLGLPLPPALKSVNVCYKHSDLLKQARNRCVGGGEQAEVTAPVIRKKVKAVKQDQGGISFSLDGMGEGGLVGGLEDGLQGGLEGGEVTSIHVYMDEGGQEQQINMTLQGTTVVYPTDNTGQIIIQGMEQETEMNDGVADKIVKINVGNMNISDIEGNYILAGAGGEGEEDMEQRLEEELEGREARLEEQLDLEAAAGREGEAVKKGGTQQNSSSLPQLAQLPGGVIQLLEPPDLHTYSASPGQFTFKDYQLGGQGGTIFLENITETTAAATFEPTPTSAIPATKGKKLVPIFPKANESATGAVSVALGRSGGGMTTVAVGGRETSPLMKIQYKEYPAKILQPELGRLVGSSELGDTRLVCRDGSVITSSLLLATLSPFLHSLLDCVPRLDPHKTVVLPDSVTVAGLSLLTSLLTAPPTTSLQPEQEEQVRDLAATLHCPALLDLLQPGTSAPSAPPANQSGNPAPPLKRKAAGSPAKRRAKAPRVAGSGAALQYSGTPVKLEKTDLNADYLDSSGLVRLSSTDEMAIHYCLLCDAKFKKYNQAITHYDSAHNLLAALACDQCDNTFRDMYSCVKHKHEFHGQFDVNFQCFICKEVLYSRFRLGTHIKECHKPHYGEFVCRACGMKFAAQYYLTNHQKESHNDSANTCTICSKTFSGKRYLTMHIKANHESQLGGGEDLFCKECERAFPSARDKCYHESKVHGAPRPDGAFEDCNHCEKWFRTKGELSQHMARMHGKVDIKLGNSPTLKK